MTGAASAEVDPRLVRALRGQLERRAETLRDGAVHVGWKLGRVRPVRARRGGALRDGAAERRREPVAEGQADLDVAAGLCAAARALAAVGMRLHAGDLVITGLVVNEPVSPGDRVAAEIGALGRAELVIDAA